MDRSSGSAKKNSKGEKEKKKKKQQQPPPPPSTTIMRKLAVLVLHTSVPIKAQLLLAFVVLGSCVRALGVLPDTVFLADKTNPVNVYLVKYSWFWTMTFLLSNFLISNTLYSAMDVFDLVKHMGRIVLSHVVWHATTSLIVFLDSCIGRCSAEGISTARECWRGGHEWAGFDISGHVFLLSYCIFLITEEAANIRTDVWAGFDKVLTESLSQQVVTAERESRLRSFYRQAGFFVVGLEMFGTVLVVVWAAMLLITSLYFHTFLEKLLGWGIGAGAWYLTYQKLYYKCDSVPFLPCRPEYGTLHPARLNSI